MQLPIGNILDAQGRAISSAEPLQAALADGYDDGFDVLQCRVDLGAGPALPETVPLARRDAPCSGDNCGNAGGLDQDIFGAMLPVS